MISSKGKEQGLSNWRFRCFQKLPKRVLPQNSPNKREDHWKNWTLNRMKEMSLYHIDCIWIWYWASRSRRICESKGTFRFVVSSNKIFNFLNVDFSFLTKFKHIYLTKCFPLYISFTFYRWLFFLMLHYESTYDI